jgi:hypothetical protein
MDVQPDGRWWESILSSRSRFLGRRVLGGRKGRLPLERLSLGWG